MRVCDRHRDRQARETVQIVGDDTYFDLCAECKTEVLMLLASDPDPKAAPPPKPSATPETSPPKRGLFFRGN